MQPRDEATGKLARPTINVTPLIDVLLVLLIIFMVIAPLRPSRFKALIPGPPIDDPHVHPSPRTLIVNVERDSTMRLIRGKELIAEGSLQETSTVLARLAQEFAERRAQQDWRPEMLNHPELSADERIQKTVFIKAPRSIHYGEVASVIDGLKGAGAHPIGLQTDELID